MRILQIATLVTPDGAYGGPIRVAVNQTRELLRLGHDVTLVAGHQGFGTSVPEIFDGIPVRLFAVDRLLPKTGFAGLHSPTMRSWLEKEIGSADVVHIHLARDLITLPAARIAAKHGIPYVVQTHGMIDETRNPLAAPLDAVLTKPLLAGAKKVFHLTPQERESLARIAPTAVLEHLPNGVPPAPHELAFREVPREVLFLARLHPRKRPVAFVAMADELAGRFPEVRFTLVGPDEGEGEAVRAAIDSSAHSQSISWIGPLDPESTSDALAGCDVYVLPSVHEPFPMSVLEAMAAARATVITDTCGLAPMMVAQDAGIVVDDSPEALVAAVAELLENSESRRRLGERAAAVASSTFSMASIGKQLEDEYLRATHSVSTRKVVIVQPYVPTYRKPFFEGLRAGLARDGIELVVAADLPQGAQAARKDHIVADWVVQTRSRRLRIAGRSIGLGGTWRTWKDADAVIVGHLGSSIDSHLAVLLGAARRIRTGVWGHIRSYVADPHPLDAALETWQLRRAHQVFAYVPSGAAYALEKGAKEDRTTIVNNTIDTERLESEIAALSEADLEEFRAQHDLIEGKTLAFVGGVDGSKRIDFIVGVLDRLWELDAGFKVIVAGTGDQVDLLAEAARRGQAVLLGRQTESGVARALVSSSAIIMPGRIGLVAVDSLVARRPILTTAFPYHAPEFEYLVEGSTKHTYPDDPIEFAERIIAEDLGRSNGADDIDWSYPTMDRMIENFRLGILDLLDGRTVTR